IDLQHLLVLVDRLLAIAVVVGGIGPWNVLLGIRCGQIQAGIDKCGVEGDSLLEVVDRLFEFRVLVSLHTLVEMVTRFQLVAAGAGEDHQCGGEYHQEPLCSFHCFMNLLAAEYRNLERSAGRPRPAGRARRPSLYLTYNRSSRPLRFWL